MTKIAIKAQKIFTADFIESNNYLIVEDNKFAGFLSKEDVKKENIPVKEYNDAFIIPGLIDTHIHGAVGHDTMDSTPEAFKKYWGLSFNSRYYYMDANYSNSST